MSAEEKNSEEVESPEIHFEPIVQLPAVELPTLEEEEEEIIHMRAKLFRFDQSDEPAQWKERGTGTVKLLRHKKSNLVRVLMRRDQTLKLCANHYVQPEMELKPNCGSDRAWVWTTTADFSDGEASSELLAIRFANAENAQKWKEKFTEAQQIMRKAIPSHNDSISKEANTSVDNGKENTEETKASGDKEENKSDETDKSDKETDSVADKLTNLTVKENGDKAKDSEEKTIENKTENEEKS
ncbi:ran-specific GTPase-activating protein-like [Ruditapes philippinarum]|uniref:ran-specific GTPase-activating protein-like n=1 Tax=Ruditapes philippinarum TaxID=129788 RepID=UPI00295A5FFB|nr:ran-specific GTPase-activating protein-like [Ruditapes philippinarum]